MELIHANAARNELGAVRDMQSFDAEISTRTDAGEAGNSWQLRLGAESWQASPIQQGHYLYVDGTEWGGPVEKVAHSTLEGIITLSGCTWRGMLQRKVICPPEGNAHLLFNEVAVRKLLAEVVLPQLGELFSVSDEQADALLTASFRYEAMLRGLRRVLAAAGLGMDVRYSSARRMAEISTRRLQNFADSIDLSQDYGMDIRTTSGSLTGYNHVVALGRGELTERQVLQLYRLDNGTITDKAPSWAGTLKERAQVYDYSSAETEEELRKGAVARLNEYAQTSSLELDASELDIPAQLGDIVGARDRVTGMAGQAPITGMILKMSSAGITIEKRVG